MADELTPEEQAAVASAGAGGGSLQLGKPKPGTTRSALHGQYVVQEVANAQGEWTIDTSVQPLPFLPGTAPADTAPHTISIPGRGIIQWEPKAKEWQLVEGTAPVTQPTYQPFGNQLLEIGPNGIKSVATDEVARARQQAELDLANQKFQADQAERLRQAGQWQQQFGLSQNADVRAGQQLLMQLESQRAGNAIQQAQLEEQQRGNEFTRNYRSFVELPQLQVQDERAAQTARLAAAAQAGTYGVQRASEGRQAGQDVVSTMLQTLPYRVSPQWHQQFLAAHQAEIEGRTPPAFTPDALGFRAPDFEGARARASQAAQAQLPTYDQLVQGAPQFASMTPEEAARLQRMLLGLPYQPVSA